MGTPDLDAIEARRLVVQARLDAGRSPSQRNRMGQFATPPQLAYEITKAAISLLGRRKSPIRFCDPALGTGSFFSALLRVAPSERIASAIGIELDSAFALAADELWSRRGLTVVEGDFTDPRTITNVPKPNLVVTNPPYVRHHHIGREQKTRLQALVMQQSGARVNGLAGLYVYFILLANAWLEDGGLGVWLVPSEFMDVKYGAVLRGCLADTNTLLRIHRFSPSDVQFDDALVSSAVVFFRKMRPAEGGSAVFTYGGTLGRPDMAQDVPLAELRRVAKWTQYPARTTRACGVRSTSAEPKLGDLFVITRGIATGANDFFIVPLEQARLRGLPDRFLRPILPSPRALPGEVVEGDDLGYPDLDRKLALIDCALPEREIENESPPLAAYLATARKRGIRERYLLRQREPWYSQEARSAPSFLCTYMGRNAKRPFRFIWNRSRAIATNVYLLLYPKEPLAGLISDQPDLERAVFEFLQQITGEDLRREGRVYGGGLYKIEPNELAQVSARKLVDSIPGLSDAVTRRGGQLAMAMDQVSRYEASSRRSARAPSARSNARTAGVRRAG